MDDFAGNDAKSKEIVRLWRAWKTAHEMVADRVRSLPTTLSSSARP